MSTHTDHPEPVARIGPGIDPTDLMAQARAEANRRDEETKLGVQVAKRLIFAAILLILVMFLCFVIFPLWGVWLPAWVPLLAFVAIIVGAVLNLDAESSDDDDTEPEDDGYSDGCAVGMCPGPRPLRAFRKKD